MTAPVLQESAPGPAGNDSPAWHAIAFVAPEGYTGETMPAPKDPRVRIPARQASRTPFSGIRTCTSGRPSTS